MARLPPLAFLLLLLLPVSWSCDAGDGSAPPPSDAASFYARLSSALQRRGAVAHVTITTSGTVDANPYATREEIWVDAANGRARSELTTGFAAPGTARTQVRITDGRALYTAPDGERPIRVEAPVCRDAPSAVAAALLGCHGHLEDARVRVEPSTFAGRETVALVAEGTAPRSDEVRGFSDALHLDARTMLPAGRTSAGSYDFGGVHAFETQSAIGVSFDRADALPAGFFDPAGIRYAARDLAPDLTRAAASVDLSWPGARLELDGLPPLALATVFVADDATAPWTGARVVLGYRDASDEFAEPSVFVRVWRAPEWREHGASPSRVMGDAVVEVQAAAASPYANAEAADALLASLTPLAP